jgi:hypothetical protein
MRSRAAGLVRFSMRYVLSARAWRRGPQLPRYEVDYQKRNPLISYIFLAPKILMTDFRMYLQVNRTDR